MLSKQWAYSSHAWSSVVQPVLTVSQAGEKNRGLSGSKWKLFLVGIFFFFLEVISLIFLITTCHNDEDFQVRTLVVRSHCFPSTPTLHKGEFFLLPLSFSFFFFISKLTLKFMLSVMDMMHIFVHLSHCQYPLNGRFSDTTKFLWILWSDTTKFLWNSFPLIWSRADQRWAWRIIPSLFVLQPLLALPQVCERGIRMCLPPVWKSKRHATWIFAISICFMPIMLLISTVVSLAMAWTNLLFFYFPELIILVKF